MCMISIRSYIAAHPTWPHIGTLNSSGRRSDLRGNTR